MSTAIRPFTEADAPAWEAFVESAPGATFFHKLGWRRVIAEAFRLQPHYLVAERGGRITGILPLVHMRSMFFGSALVSTPFCVEGGAVAEDAETVAQLEAHAAQLTDRLGLKTLEIRAAGALPPGWAEKADLYFGFCKPIVADDEANLKAIPRKQRAVVRKGIGFGLRSTVSHDADVLHRVYAESVRNLGSPVFPRRYFRLLAREFADCCDVVTILDEDVPLASVMNFYFRGIVMPYYGGGTARARERAGNDFMYWEVMRLAAAKGCTSFDFGRSKAGTGAFAFKEHWGFKPHVLRYRYRLAAGQAIPENNPLNPKYRLMIKTWKKLPVAVANVIGPQIVRGLG